MTLVKGGMERDGQIPARDPSGRIMKGKERGHMVATCRASVTGIKNAEFMKGELAILDHEKNNDGTLLSTGRGTKKVHFTNKIH